MKPTVAEDEFEDAEEENKFINEVCQGRNTATTQLLSCSAGVQDMVGKISHVQVASCTMFQQEEERPILVRSDDNACPRLAKSNLPMVPRRRIVRHLSLTHSRSSHLVHVVPPHKID